MDWDVIDLGRMAYAPALEVQREKNLAVSLGEDQPALLLVEHDPVITVSHRKGVREHLLASEARLAELGIEVQDTDRGGDITYHGPGQLVVYPVLRLGDYGLNLGRYMRLLEEVVIATLARYGVEGVTEAGATGVWVADEQQSTAKICALGVRVRKNTTMHGLALNVTTDLSHFATIDPCGLGNRPVTSLRKLLGTACPEMDTVKTHLADELSNALMNSTHAKHIPGAGTGTGVGP